MTAAASAVATQFFGSGGGSAFVDPFIQVDPSFPDANLYTITFSDGVANTKLGSMIRIQQAAETNALQITYFGVLQQSTDLVSWTDVSPQPTNPYIFVPGDYGPKMFFRANSP
jgi:hypothetical protein